MSDTPTVLDERCSHGSCAGKGFYIMVAKCSNCGWSGKSMHTKSHDASRGTCPVCECTRVQFLPTAQVDL